MLIIREVVLLGTCICLFGSLISCSMNNNDGSADITSERYRDSAEEIVIHLANSGGESKITEAVEKFNELNTGYRVEIVEYEHPDLYANGGVPQQSELNLIDFELIQDLINTTDIDIVTNTCFYNQINYINLLKKGAFTDLYKFMAGDDEINTKTLNNPVLKLNETDGALMSIPLFYEVCTVGGNSQYVGNKENWTFDEMKELWNKMPENSTIFGGRTKENAFYVTIRHNIVKYIDYTNGTVHFDSDDFRDALEFCNSFEYGNQQKVEYDYSAPSFCFECTIDAYMPTANFELGSNEPKITLVGYPSSDGNGAYLTACGNTFSVLNSSDKEKQDGAWQFIRTFLTEEWQEENAVYHDGSTDYFTQSGFCINLKANENIKKKVVEKTNSPSTYESKGETVEVQFPSIEDCNALDAYIDRVNRWETGVNESINEIIKEEAFDFFASEITIDQCVERIQNRMSILISEQS